MTGSCDTTWRDWSLGETGFAARGRPVDGVGPASDNRVSFAGAAALRKRRAAHPACARRRPSGLRGDIRSPQRGAALVLRLHARPHHDAEDALQATFSSAHRALLHDDRELALRPWLFVIARNACVSIIRKRHAWVELNGEAAREGDPVRGLEVREEVRHLVDRSARPARAPAGGARASRDGGSQPARGLGCDGGAHVPGEGLHLPGALEPDRGAERSGRRLR